MDLDELERKVASSKKSSRNTMRLSIFALVFSVVMLCFNIIASIKC